MNALDFVFCDIERFSFSIHLFIYFLEHLHFFSLLLIHQSQLDAGFMAVLPKMSSFIDNISLSFILNICLIVYDYKQHSSLL